MRRIRRTSTRRRRAHKGRELRRSFLSFDIIQRWLLRWWWACGGVCCCWMISSSLLCKSFITPLFLSSLILLSSLGQKTITNDIFHLRMNEFTPTNLPTSTPFSLASRIHVSLLSKSKSSVSSCSLDCWEEETLIYEGLGNDIDKKMTAKLHPCYLYSYLLTPTSI